MNLPLKYIHVLDASQIEIIATLAREIWEQHYPPITGLEQTQYILANFQSAIAISCQIVHGYLYFLISTDQDHVGYFALVADSEQHLVQLSKIYIKQEYRGKGYGKQIINFAKDYCTEVKAQELWLTVNRFNTNAIAFYLSVGFEISGEILQDLGNGYFMDDYKMVLSCMSPKYLTPVNGQQN